MPQLKLTMLVLQKGTISVAQFADMHGWDTSHETREITDLKMGQSEAKLKKSTFFAKEISCRFERKSNSAKGEGEAFTNSWFHQLQLDSQDQKS